MENIKDIDLTVNYLTRWNARKSANKQLVADMQRAQEIMAQTAEAAKESVLGVVAKYAAGIIGFGSFVYMMLDIYLR